MSNRGPKSFFTEIGLATTKDGFAAGILAAVLLQLGFVKVVAIEQSIAIWLLLAFALYLTYYHATKRKSWLSPPLDGFMLGFGWVFGLLNLARTIPS